MKYCKAYCGAACIDGHSCSKAQYESVGEEYGYDLAEDMGLERTTCRNCWHYKGCEDCYNNSPADGRICEHMKEFQPK